MQFMQSMWDRSNILALRGLMLAITLFPGLARANFMSDINGKIGVLCSSFLKPFVTSKVVSLVMVLILITFLFLWWMNENKEGVMITLLKTIVAVMLIINIFTIPALVGLPAVCT